MSQGGVESVFVYSSEGRYGTDGTRKSQELTLDLFNAYRSAGVAPDLSTGSVILNPNDHRPQAETWFKERCRSHIGEATVSIVLANMPSGSMEEYLAQEAPYYTHVAAIAAEERQRRVGVKQAEEQRLKPEYEADPILPLHRHMLWSGEGVQDSALSKGEKAAVLRHIELLRNLGFTTVTSFAKDGTPDFRPIAQEVLVSLDGIVRPGAPKAVSRDSALHHAVTQTVSGRNQPGGYVARPATKPDRAYILPDTVPPRRYADTEDVKPPEGQEPLV